MDLDIGIDEMRAREMARALARAQADTYVLYLKTHYYHWNVTGPLFHSLHALFEQQYRELFNAVDLIAERIRVLGYRAPGTWGEFGQLTSLQEDATVPEAEAMVRQLAEDHLRVCQTLRNAISLAQQAGDEGSLALLTDRLQAHEKTVWMLRSHLHGARATAGDLKRSA